jgi:hypothetical protein
MLVEAEFNRTKFVNLLAINVLQNPEGVNYSEQFFPNQSFAKFLLKGTQE